MSHTNARNGAEGKGPRGYLATRSRVLTSGPPTEGRPVAVALSYGTAPLK